MALLAEEIIEEWLNRHGYFTMRGIKIGNNEIDILAMKPLKTGVIECRHIEVQCGMRPVSYITRVPKEIQKTNGRPPNDAKARSEDELIQGVLEWVEKKFTMEKKQNLKQQLCPTKWSQELVVHKVKHPKEVELIKNHGIKIHELKDIINDLIKTNQTNSIIQSACGGDLCDLIMIDRS